jgi:hypothetical protein
MPTINGMTVDRVTEFTVIRAIDLCTQKDVGTIDYIVTYADRAEVIGEVHGKGTVHIMLYKDVIWVLWHGGQYRCDATVNLLSRAEIVEWSGAVLVAIDAGKVKPPSKWISCARGF